MLWLKAKHGDALPVYVSVPPEEIAKIKHFIRLVDPETDLYIGTGPGREDLFKHLDPTHPESIAIEGLASQKVNQIWQRLNNDNQYVDNVIEPLRGARERIFGALPMASKGVGLQEQTVTRVVSTQA
jgi:pyrrolidone-carboxylate peptidase